MAPEGSPQRRRRRQAHRGYLNSPSDGFAWPADLSPARADAPSFCRPSDRASRLAVLGIFSADAHIAHRREIRRSWLHSSPESGIAAHFVLHGRGAHSLVLDEAVRHGDIVFLDGEAEMPRKQGPLAKLLLWMRCAAAAWPGALLVGKADDDTWVHMSGVARQLRASLSGGGRYIYWGRMETFHWYERAHRPAAFAGRYGRGEHCMRRRVPLGEWERKHGELGYGAARSWPRADDEEEALVGPFEFAKGPLVFLSRPLAEQVASSRWVQREHAATLRSANHSTRESTWPWEDVFLGLSVAHLAEIKGHRLASVHIGSELFSHCWGFCMSNSSLVWHLRTKSAQAVERISAAHHWASLHHCSPTYSIKCRAQEHIACPNKEHAGASWLRCSMTEERDLPGHNSCPTRYHDLLSILYHRKTWTGACKDCLA